MAIDFGAFPPEFNSARMYAGPGPGSMAVAAALWDELAADLYSAASAYRSVITGLTTQGWMGPSSLAMASAFGPYAAWMAGAAARAAETASQARLAVEVWEAAFAMTVPPVEVAANRARLAALVATNILGQNTAAIAATEAEYAEMWALDAAAMYGYAAGSAEAAMLTGFTPVPDVVNPAGVELQESVQGAQAGTSTSAGAQSAISQLMSALPTTLNSLASPLAAPLTDAGAGGSSAAAATGLFGGTTGLSSIAQSVIASYAVLPGWAAMFFGGDALGPLMNPDVFLPFAASAAAAAPAAAASTTAPAALVSTLAGTTGGLGGGMAGLGQAAAVGGLSVPANWGWAAGGPAMLGGMPLASPVLPLPGTGLGTGLGAPLMFGALPRAAAAGSGGTAAAKYGPRMSVVARPPAAGYPASATPLPAAGYSMPAGLPPPAPGYTPAIVYLPTNGHATVPE
ncbi:PPE family protein [Mycobacterium sp. 663a-19]|uniref:PPE family protein n=1 Tax=Mycobacterium sp. 663a-19 TaxID=2986148 RepID=UPI002D1F93DF|nr:PPE family protein [Mycobacterium sp. 663a-19]MEB3980328.1 PPE family protein [Mycobacterium sp. 663a-19]